MTGEEAVPAQHHRDARDAQPQQHDAGYEGKQCQKAEQKGKEVGRRACFLPEPKSHFCTQFARKAHGIAQRLCDFDLAPTLGQAFVEMAGIVAEELVDFSRRQTGQATAQGVQKLSFGHLSTPTIFAAGAALVSDRTLATAATKPFHSTFCAIRAAWPALVS